MINLDDARKDQRPGLKDVAPEYIYSDCENIFY